MTPPRVAVVGGSLGAGRINRAALGLYDRWRDRDRPHDPPRHRRARLRRVPHDAGGVSAPRGDRLVYPLVPLRGAHGHRCTPRPRSWCPARVAMTAELAASGMPSVLVPLPGAPGDHQTANAEALVAAGAAVMIPDAELDAGRLATRARRAARRSGPPRRDEHGGAHARPARRRRPLRRPVRGACACRLTASPSRTVHVRMRSSTATSTSPPHAVHIVGVGGAGMSAIATVLARMGHTRQRLRPPRVARARAARPARRHHATSGTRPSNLPDALDAVVISTAIPATNPEVVAARSPRRPGAPTRRRAARDRRDPHAPIAVAGSHGKTTTSSMLALDPARRGLAPELPHRRRPERGRHERGVRRRRVARRRGRRERRHVPRARARSRDRHQRRARPPRPLRRLRRARRARSSASSDASRARVRALRRRRRRRPASRRRRPGAWSPSASPTTPTTGSATTRAAATARSSRSRTRRRARSAWSSCRCPGRHNATNAAGAAAMALELGVPFDAVDARARRLRRVWRAGSSSAASTTASPSSTTTRTSRARSTRMIARRA